MATRHIGLIVAGCLIGGLVARSGARRGSSRRSAGTRDRGHRPAHVLDELGVASYDAGAAACLGWLLQQGLVRE
jgi:hypothetical protein